MDVKKGRKKARRNETSRKVSVNVEKMAVTALHPASMGGRADSRQIEMVPPKSLKESARNARTHPKTQIE